MTHFRYFAWRIAKTFGISMSRHHASHAAAELHLLREADEILGRMSWKDTEELKELSVEYWNLRKLTNQYDELSVIVSSANVDLQRSHEQRAELLEMVVDSTKDLVVERESLIDKSERLGAEREAILGEARSVKRRHDGIKAKLEVLAGEGAPRTPDVDESKAELLKLKKRFKALRERRDTLAVKIDNLDNEVKEIDGRIEKRRADMRDEAFESYQSIGKANRGVSHTRAELGILETEMSALFGEIGRYILANHSHPSLDMIVRNNRSLVNQMAALRISINLNNQLCGRETPAPKA
jgi:chromosome segregation ATPase